MKTQSIFENISTTVRKVTKRTYQQLLLQNTGTKQMVFVVGSQRSGTTMLMNSFKRDFRTKVYGEKGLATADRRLRPFDEIERIISGEKAQIIVVKPLVDTQHIVDLLEYFPNSKAIWAYRNYKDVANSSLKKFGTQSTVKNLGAVINPDMGNRWFAESVSENTRELVAKYYAEDMPPYDGKILIWYTRNILFFELNLDQNPNVMLCKYEDIVTKPDQIMRKIYAFLDAEYPGDHVVGHIHSWSVKLGKDITVSSKLEELCADLFQKMDRVYEAYNTKQSQLE